MKAKVIEAPRSDSGFGTPAGCSCTCRRRRSKADWAGIGIGDAFKPNLDYFLRVSAQRLFYAACRKVQLAAASVAGSAGDSGYQPKAKPQLGPCYTGYPSTLAAYSAIGLTGFLEFQSAAGRNVLGAHMAEYLKDPAGQDDVPVEPILYLKMVQIIVHTVQTRLLLEDLARSAGMSAVELYRLFASSQQSLRFDSVPAILDALILYGDVLPDWEGRPLHNVTRTLLRDLGDCCAPYLARLAAAQPQELLQIGISWTRALCKCVAKYMPAPQQEANKSAATGHGDAAGGATPSGDVGRPSQQANGDKAPERIAPLNGPNRPGLFAPPTAAENAAEAVFGRNPAPAGEPSPEQLRAVQTLEKFSRALDQAAGQKEKWEDMRSDLVERAMTVGTFAESPIQGNPTDGHEVKIQLGKGDAVGGEIHDRPVELSDNLPACTALAAESLPIAEALRQTLYPNVEELMETERLRTTGALDPARLSTADFSAAVFRRHRVNEKADRKGKPLLLIACDGSGSLNSMQMKMVKVLAAAWLSSTVRTRVQIMAGLYHSGEIRKGVSGPLVQWIYHPQKTPAVGRKDAVRALVSLPDTGTGVQSDALSLMFMVNEAARVARGKMIYLVVISDCQWNKSFSTKKSGQEEVIALFENVARDFGDNLHSTLVALGSQGKTGLEELLDKVIMVPADKLTDYAGLAEQIGVYVASCMKERRRFAATK